MPVGKFTAVVTTAPVIPSQQVAHFSEYLTNSGSAAMAVNGSSTPQIFNKTVPANQTWYITGISLVLSDPGTMQPEDFRSIEALTSGLLLETSISGVAYTVCNLRTNLDIELLLGRGGAGSGESGLFDTAGWMDTADLFSGTRIFLPALTLMEGDSIKFTVRDNLTGIATLAASINYWRTLP